MNLDPALAVALIFALGVGAQLLAWKLKVPSILFLLSGGFLVGPISQVVLGEPILEPDKLFGDLLLPLVAISVGLILYEGGLTLRFNDIRKVRTVVRNLVSIGALVTWVLASTAAYLLPLGIGLSLSILFGAILVVTGPTVIQPLVEHIRPKGSTGPILKWEGIVIDPIGALLAVLVFEVIVADAAGSAAGGTAMALVNTIIFGGGLGFAAALILKVAIQRFWIPEALQNPVSLLLVVGVFVICDKIQKESGLLATTVMGIVLANQSSADVRHIIEFKENLRVLLISSLFIVLGARLDAAALADVGLWSIAFVGIMILLVRPVSVLSSTFGAGLSKAERVFLMWMAPRGIVAAAVASVFGLALENQAVEGAERLVPLTFAVIIGTVAFYGLTAPLAAKRLGLSDDDPQGLLIVGAGAWIRQVAAHLDRRGVRVLLVDSNRDNTRAARMDNLGAYYGSVLADHAMEEIELTGLGRMLAVTPNDEVNALATQRFASKFGRREIYQLAPRSRAKKDGQLSRELSARVLFDDEATHDAIEARIRAGHIVKSTTLSESFDFERYRALYGPRTLMLFVVREDGRVAVCASETPIEPQPGETVVAIVDPEDLLLG